MDNHIDYLKRYLDPSQLADGIKRYQNGEPLQYIVGNVDFYGYQIKVNHDVLIPRFETELLVSKTLNYIKEYFNQDLHILDLGTGSGCIAITLKKQLPKSKVTAIDISDAALQVAKDNAFLNNADITLFKSDMLTKIVDQYDVIISNPPYIGHDEEVMDLVKDNEPHLALYTDNDGLKYYQDILKNAGKNLNDKFIIAFEIGSLQGQKVSDLAHLYFKECQITIESDYANLDRFVFIIKK